MLLMQHLMPLVHYSAIVSGLDKISAPNGKRLVKCLGRYEILFDHANEGADFCTGWLKWSLGWLFCRTMTFYSLITSSNFLEMYLLWKSYGTVMASTENVKGLLSLSAYRQRKR